MTITVTRTGPIAIVTLDRPPVNALALETYGRLGDTFASVADDTDIRCVILRAEGERAFCAGVDLKDFLDARTAEEDRRRTAAIFETFRAIYTCAVPVIAVVHAPALGAGMAIASLCDIRLATPRATFGLPEINAGRCGGGAFAGRYLPQGIMRRMFYTGEPISAQEALRYGLIEDIVAEGELLPAAMALATKIASKSPIAMRLAKESLNACEGMPSFDGYAIEQRYSERLFETEDAREAALSIIEKRAPNFVGR